MKICTEKEVDRRFNDIWREYMPYIRKLCEYKLRDRLSDADDCVQDTFDALLTALNDGTQIINMKAWLTGTAYHKIKDCLKKMSIEENRNVPLDENLTDTASDYDSADDEITDEELLAAKDRVLESLTEKEAELYRERVVMKKSVTEIAQAHSVSDNNISQQLFRLRAKIRIRAKEYIIQHIE